MQTARCLMALAWFGLPGVCPAEEPDLGGRWIVIGRTEQQAGPGLVGTDPYSGLRAGYFVKVEGAFRDRAAALARQRKLAGAGCGPERCYLRFTGERHQPIELAAARTAAERASDGKAVFAATLSLRGRDIPLVIARSGPLEAQGPDCPMGGEEDGTRTQVWLFWSAPGRKLAEWRGESGLLCCAPWKVRAAPERLRVLTAECQALSCGGVCGQATRVVAVPEDMPHAAVAEELHCDQVVSAYPIAALESTCDKLEVSPSGFRMLRPEVRTTPCPGDENSVKRAEARTRSLLYEDGLFKRSTGRWAPRMREAWGCPEGEDEPEGGAEGGP